MEICGINITVERKNIKTLRLRVKPDGKVFVSAPKRATNAQIDLFVRSNIGWIRAKLYENATRKPDCSFEDGDTIKLFGEELTLRIVCASRVSVRVSGSEVILVVKEGTSADGRKEAIDKLLYKKALERIVPTIAQKYEEKLGVKAQSWSYRNMKTRWGSCSTQTGKMRINTKLAAHPPECIEYVVLHELCHLIEANHSARFYALVEAQMPDWKERRKRLNGKGEEI